MYNKVIMVGNLTRDIELRYLPSGAALAKSAIASSYKYKTATGEQKDEVCFLDFNIFGRSGEVANQYLKKGSKVLLEGRLVLEQWAAQDGTDRSKHSLRVDVMKMLDSKADSQSQGGQSYNNGTDYQQNNQQSMQQPEYNNQQPTQQSPQNNNQQQNIQQNQNIPQIDIDEDEIPF